MSSKSNSKDQAGRRKRLPYEPPRAIELGELVRSAGGCNSGTVEQGSCAVGGMAVGKLCHSGLGPSH